MSKQSRARRRIAAHRSFVDGSRLLPLIQRHGRITRAAVVPDNVAHEFVEFADGTVYMRDELFGWWGTWYATGTKSYDRRIKLQRDISGISA